jgi:hypothetical protein
MMLGHTRVPGIVAVLLIVVLAGALAGLLGHAAGLVPTQVGGNAIACRSSAAIASPLGGSGQGGPRQGAATRAPDSSGFYDNFKTDNSLNAGIWTTEGAVSTQYGPYISGPPAAIVSPVLTFGKGNGMQFSGVTGELQAAFVQSIQSYEPPFYVSAGVSGSAVFGNAASLGILSGDGSQGVGIFGNLNSSNRGYYGINSIFPLLNHSGHPAIYGSPQLNAWYDYNISVTSAGAASLTVQSNGSTLGSQSFSVGVGPFYILIIEFEGIPAVYGSDFVNWSYASEGVLASTGGSTSSPAPGIGSEWWLWVLAIVIIVVFLLLVRIRRKRSGRAPIVGRSSTVQPPTSPPPPN